MEIESTRLVFSGDNDLQQWQRDRSWGSRTRSVLGGSSIVEGGFERSVSPAMWEQRIGNVGGEMGFASVGGGTSDRRLRVGWSCVSLSLVRGVELWALTVGGSATLVGLWVELGLAWGRRWSSVITELEEYSWCMWGVRVRSVERVCEKCKSFKGK